MTRTTIRTTAFLNLVLAILTAGAAPAVCQVSDPVIIDSGVFPAGQPILVARDDGSRLYAVTGRLASPYWGFAFYVSSNGGASWTKTYDQVWSDDFTRVDAVLEGDAVYVGQIDSWSSGSTEYFDLTVQRFDADGVRDASFGGSGTVTVSGTTTLEISDVALVAGAGYLEVFWVQENLLRHSYMVIPSVSTGVHHSDLNPVTVFGSLDAVIMSGASTDFFVAFLGEGLQLRGWRWTLGAGQAIVDITPSTDLYPEYEEVTVSSFGEHVEIVVATPFDDPLTKVYSMWSNDDAVTWNQQLITAGSAASGLHVWDPSVVTGAEGSVLTYQVKEDDAGLEWFRMTTREHGSPWSGSGDLTADTDFIGTPMGLSWSAGAGFTGVYYSNDPVSSTVNFIRLNDLFRDGFESGDLGAWSSMVGD